MGKADGCAHPPAFDAALDRCVDRRIGRSDREMASEVKPTDFYRWWITDPRYREAPTPSWRMTRVEALKHDPDPKPDPGSLEVRVLPEGAKEWNVSRGPQ